MGSRRGQHASDLPKNCGGHHGARAGVKVVLSCLKDATVSDI